MNTKKCFKKHQLYLLTFHKNSSMNLIKKYIWITKKMLQEPVCNAGNVDDNKKSLAKREEISVVRGFNSIMFLMKIKKKPENKQTMSLNVKLQSFEKIKLSSFIIMYKVC